ncbi:MAG TPA: carbohydrate-binding protein [Cytophagales bacterium]|nr:carbohydrate-binding protein [Cytophagales bacterium]
MKHAYKECPKGSPKLFCLSDCLNHIKLFKYFLLFLFSLITALSTQAQSLIWRDEFNSSKVDDEKWTREVGGGGNGNGELQYYTSGEQNVFIGSKTNASDTGYLVIEARRENYGIPPENRQFTSGRINTSGKFNVQYGTIEARIKLPDLQNGLWPAFWMLGANYPEVGWPRSGEIDIMETGFQGDWQSGVANKKTHSTVHWHQDNYLTLVPDAHAQGWYGNASASGDTTISGNFYDGYHVFKMEWTPSELKGYVDNIHFYTFTIPTSDENITEFSSNPYYVILNLAVGGSNFVGITDPAQITAPMPAQMMVDYVRVYSNTSTTSFIAKDLAKETGTFGVFTETKPVDASLGANPEIEVWNNLAAATSSAYEGSQVLSFTAASGDWFGLGIPSPVKNMQNFTDGILHFHMKTSSTHPLSIGIISTINGNAQAGTQSKTVKLDPAGNQYGLVRDGNWHEVKIPLSMFGNVEFRSVKNMFYLVGDAPSSSVTFAIDNIYWADGTKVTPQNGDFVLYSDTKTGVDKFDQPADGNFNVWEATLTAQATTPSEGANVLSFTNNNKGWFGAAFTANNMHNLTAYKNANAKLVFSMKTSDTTTPFHIGMKSGTRDGEGQKWIAFEPGQNPYGFVRNGTWQTVQIPMSHFYESIDLMQVNQLFEILGTGNIANIAIDNIYFTGGLTAEPDDNGATNTPPTANAGTDKIITLPTNSVVLNGSGTDTDGSIAGYAWTRLSGPNTPTLSGANSASLTANGLVAGTYVFRLTVTDNGGATGFDDVAVTVSQSSSKVIPGKIEAENWDGMSGVQTEGTSDTGGGQNVGWIETGDYMDYNVNVQTSGQYTVEFRVASTGTTGQVQLRNGATVLGTANVPNTGGWQVWTTVSANVSLTSGVQTLRVYASSSPFNINWINFVAANNAPEVNAGSDKTITLPTNSVIINGSASDSDGSISSYAWTRVSGPNTPTLSGANSANLTASGLVVGSYVFRLTATDNLGTTGYDEVAVTVNSSTSKAIPGKIEAENYDGMLGIETEGTSDTGGGQNVGWIDMGDYLDYNVNVQNSGLYTVEFRVASTGTTGQVQLRNGATVLGTANVPNTGGWQVWTTVSIDVSLTSGAQTLRVYASAAPFNLNWINFKTASNVNLALNKPTTVSSTENAGSPGSAAVDGNAGTRWSSAFADPQWIYVDLEATYSVNRVKVTWEAAYGSNYQVQISSNASTWTNLKTITGNSSLVNDHTGLSGTGRYIRIYGTARGTAYGYSIFELEVYGSGAARFSINEESSEDGILLYPNPTVDELKLNGITDGSSIVINNARGSKVLEGKSSNGSINVSHLSQGIYIILIKDGDKLIKKSFIKQ